MSDTWEDLGNTPKVKNSDVKKIYAKLTTPTKLTPESDEQTRMRLLGNQAAIESLGVPIEKKELVWSVVIKDRKIDFWPATDTYFLHAQNKYGHDIKKLVGKIMGYLQ